MNSRALKQCENVRNQLNRITERLEIQMITTGNEDSPEYFANIRRAMLSGFFMQVAHLQKANTYLTVKDQQV